MLVTGVLQVCRSRWNDTGQVYYKYAEVGGMTLHSVYCVFHYNLYFIIFQFYHICDCSFKFTIGIFGSTALTISTK